jgi:hypothetical protein
MDGLRIAGSAIVAEWRAEVGPDANGILSGFGCS